MCTSDQSPADRAGTRISRQKWRFAPLFDQPLIDVMPCRQGDRAPCPVALSAGLATKVPGPIQIHWYETKSYEYILVCT